jgi:hypothetical protein
MNIIQPVRDVSVTGRAVLAPVLGKLAIGQVKMHPGTKKHPPDVGGVRGKAEFREDQSQLCVT